MINLPPITKQQYQLILLILKFRYTTSDLTSKYFNHKDNKTAKDWLRDLTEKGYLNIIKKPKDITAPYIYCLAQKTRHLVKNEKTLNINMSNYFYREKNRSDEFININLMLLNLYIKLKNNLKENEQLHFYNKHEIKNFKEFPKDADAYIALQKKTITKRYFVDYLTGKKNSEKSFKFNIHKYFKYFSDGSWQAFYDKKLPDIVIITDNERRRNHAFHYCLAKLNKSFEEFNIYLTTKDHIRFNQDISKLWMKVK